MQFWSEDPQASYFGMNSVHLLEVLWSWRCFIPGCVDWLQVSVRNKSDSTYIWDAAKSIAAWWLLTPSWRGLFSCLIPSPDVLVTSTVKPVLLITLESCPDADLFAWISYSVLVKRGKCWLMTTSWSLKCVPLWGKMQIHDGCWCCYGQIVSERIRAARCKVVTKSTYL